MGIGASAGGLDAISTFFDAMPARNGMAFVVVQHLDPRGKSHLTELLSRHTALRVQVASDGLEIAPDNVYVCVPSRDLVLSDGHIRLVDPEPERSQRRPIDRFFDSLASAYGERAVAVVLTGAAADGSRGIAAVKAAGGIVIVQDPDLAEFDSMPRSAVQTGLADVVLPIEEMAATLQRFAEEPRRPATNAVHSANDGDGQTMLNNILGVLHTRFGYDFKDYKRPTLLRRTQRRMSLRNVDAFEAYAALVHDDDNEAASLFRDLMINVSSFFRDPEAWEELVREVLDPMIAQRENGDDLRAWSVGCATGEEPYSLGILLTERIEAAGKRIKPQIFASDVSDSLEAARAGKFPATIAAELSPERLNRFFVRHDSTYEVSKQLRDLIVFARHNVISDPPFSRMDLICCRNMLIYIEPETQRKILWMFNFALRDGGSLFLGSAETIGSQTELFEPISAQWRIFRSCRTVHAGRFDFPRFSVANTRHGLAAGTKHHSPIKDQYFSLAQRELLDHYAPPSVVIDAERQVLIYHGDTSRYLTQPSGEPTRDILSMVAPGIRPPLRHAIGEALGEKRPVITTNGYLKTDGIREAVTVTVRPIGSLRDSPPLLMVTFEAPAAPPVAVSLGAANGSASEQTVEQLEEELRLTREELHELSAQYDRLVEEYSTSNEEMLSINEELQSANEELETSKEELQSLNEELNTLNNELRSKFEVVEQTNNDLNNLLASTEIATLFLDMECRVRWFTPPIKRVLNLISSDVGRPVRDLAATVTGSRLDEEARGVLESLVPVESEVADEAGHCYIRRVLPYRTSDNRIDGIVATFVDITEHKRGQQQRERLMHELSHRIKNTLATVQAIAQGLARRCETLPDFLAAFEPRLAALARAHATLTLRGAEPIGLRDVLDRELAPYVGDHSQRVTIEGDDLSLGREAAIAIEMVFHELVTNASKYGALSRDAGTIAVRWRRTSHDEREHVCIEWTESGGPVVKPPVERGFGSLLIESSVAHDLAGTVEMRYEPDGLQCTIKFPLTEGKDA